MYFRVTARRMIETLGNLGDFIGGMGVVVTLVYLASQIRQNTRSIRLAAFHTAQRDVAQWMDNLAADPELVRMFFEGATAYPDLNQIDKRRYASLMSAPCKRLETLVHESNTGNIDEAQWSGIREHLNLPGHAAWWREAQTLFNRETSEYVNRYLLHTQTVDAAAKRAPSNQNFNLSVFTSDGRAR